MDTEQMVERARRIVIHAPADSPTREWAEALLAERAAREAAERERNALSAEGVPRWRYDEMCTRVADLEAALREAQQCLYRDGANAAGEVKALIDAVLGEQEATPECTGLAATWCPVHGDCTCRPYGPGVADHKDDPTCPLHAPSSPHGEPVGEQEATPPEPEAGEGESVWPRRTETCISPSPASAPQGEAEPPKGAA